ncbi:MAG: STAS domain-containing protein [Acidimicrobiales bacterium]
MGDATVLVLSGEIDGSAAGVLDAAYDGVVPAGSPGRVILDFQGVDYINSTGIALIVSVLAKARSEGRTIVATGLSEHYRRIFEITRLSDFIKMYADVDQAVGAAREPAI